MLFDIIKGSKVCALGCPQKIITKKKPQKTKKQPRTNYFEITFNEFK